DGLRHQDDARADLATGEHGMVSALGQLDRREDDPGALRRTVAHRLWMHAAPHAPRGARTHPRRPHGRGLALPSRDGHCGLEARAPRHRGAGQLPRPCRRFEDHRLAERGAAHRLSHDRAHPAPAAGVTPRQAQGHPDRRRGVRRRATAAAVIVVVALFATRSLSYIPRWFVMPWTEDIWGYVPDEIRPFPAVSYVITSWFGAAAPEPNHLVNIALHAANGLLVMWIAEAAAGLGLVS